MKQYHTQMEAAKMGIITPEMETVAKKEYISTEELRELVATEYLKSIIIVAYNKDFGLS